jgi:hypothetical protein
MSVKSTISYHAFLFRLLKLYFSLLNEAFTGYKKYQEMLIAETVH